MSLAKHFSHVKWHLGRSSNPGVTATVFGAYGFIGRYVVNRLARGGARVVVPYRGDDYEVKHLKVMGDLGQIVPYEMSIRNYDEIERAVASSNVVINMLGKPFETRRFSFEQINVQFPRVLGAICTDLGVDRVVHFSALGASASAESKWLRTKHAGEMALREEYPGATVLRPAMVVGPEDKIFNKIADLAKIMPMMPLVSGAAARQQPVYCLDVAAAVQAVLMREVSAARRHGAIDGRAPHARRRAPHRAPPRRRRRARRSRSPGPKPSATSSCTSTSTRRSDGRWRWRRCRARRSSWSARWWRCCPSPCSRATWCARF